MSTASPGPDRSTAAQPSAPPGTSLRVPAATVGLAGCSYQSNHGGAYIPTGWVIPHPALSFDLVNTCHEHLPKNAGTVFRCTDAPS